jgi:hypothetical protein
VLWSSVSDPSRDRVDSFGIGFMRLATVPRNAENWQQRPLQENLDQQSQLHAPPTIHRRMREERHPAQCLEESLAHPSPVCTFVGDAGRRAILSPF